MLSQIASLSLGLALAISPVSPNSTGPALERAVSHYNLGKQELAIDGYDPVAYFKVGGGSPTVGKKKYQVQFGGALYRFASEANLETFVADPQRFEPRYGGWCAWAMSKGQKVEVDPKSFLVEGNTLLLFYKGWVNDTRAKWIKKTGAKVAPIATENWIKLSGEHGPVTLASGNLGGLDPVSYARGKEPVQGSSETTSTINGVKYQFSTPKNRTEFLRTPARFLPRFGGHAALALAAGKLIESDPKVFIIEDGAPVLFIDAKSRDAWLADSSKKRAAESAWNDLIEGRKEQK